MKRSSLRPMEFMQNSQMKVMLFAAAALMLFTVCPRAFSQNVAREAANSNLTTTAAKSDAAAIPPKAGETAPDFRLPYATMEKIYLKPEEYMALSSMRGKNVILAFYPADWSGGCTEEVCTLRDTFAELQKLNAVVLGISGDYAFSHHEWAKFHKLQFPLLSDHDHKIARLYGSFNEENGYNKRTVFLIDKAGVVRYSNLDFKAGDINDYNRLREELSKLK